MKSFVSLYRSIFARFGYPLTKSHGVSRSVLVKTEKRLGVHIPEALRDYYLVAGKERRFSQSEQRFLHPDRWFVDHRHIAFVEENQTVCWWGVSVKSPKSKNPGVWQGQNEDPITWVSERSKCSLFITVLLHYHAAGGALPFCGYAEAPDNLHELLKRDWTYVGEGNQLWAFSRQNQVVCVQVGSGLPHLPAMMLLAGGRTENDLRSIEESLSIRLKS